jgi:predicted ATPase
VGSPYESLLKSTRQHYHQRIAQVLATQFSETTEAQPELLAHHYTEAGLIEQSIASWQKAGQRAMERSAHVEAIAHLRQGLELLKTLPETPDRTQHDVDMHIALGTALRVTKGQAAPEVGEVFLYAQQRCTPLEESQRLFPVLRGLCSYYATRAEYQTAYALGEQLLALAQHTQDPAMLMAAHRALGSTGMYLGTAVSAQTHFTQGITLYDAQQPRPSVFLYGEDTGVICRSYSALVLWSLGYPDQALARNQEAVTLAQEMAHPPSWGYVLSAAALLHQYRREAHGTQERAEAIIRLAQEQGFRFWLAFGSMLCGWVLAQQGHATDGIEQLTAGLRAFRATGAEIRRPYFLALLAEAYGIMRQPEAGLTALAEALALVDATGERRYEPELYRLKGELLLQQHANHQTEAESCFHHALAIARDQQAKPFELRTATSLARLWQQQGKRQKAHDLLAPVYQWFTEGLDTADLQDAKALLEALA